MRWRLGRWTEGFSAQQRTFEFLERADRLDRRFKRAIAGLTTVVIVGVFVATEIGRYTAVSAGVEGRNWALRQIGLEPGRAEIDALWKSKRLHSAAQTRNNLARFYRDAKPSLQHLLQLAGMGPENGIIRWGRAEQAFLVSSRVFETDDRGRSYRMRPNTRSVWLRQITIRNGPLSLFQVPDDSDIRAAAFDAGAIVDENSIQTTNSWGLRGPEPDTRATFRGLVLGDSFMQGMFLRDDDTPSMYLERFLHEIWKQPVSILNTGHIGYSPEQYYYTLLEYGDRFKPHFLVVSVCPNDFGEGADVLRGRGDWWREATFWLENILIWCRARNVICLVVPIPCEEQFLGPRKDGYYAGQVSNICPGSALRYCNPLDDFIDEHLRLAGAATRQGQYVGHSPLYNGQIADNHFSPRGAELWAQVVGRRIDLILSAIPAK